LDAPERSEEVARSLAGRLEAYLASLPEDERAMLQHVLCNALPPDLRARLVPDPDLLSEADRDLLDRFSRE
jgi:hypothetical protein